MLTDIKEYVSSFTALGSPVIYKGLEIRPVKMKNRNMFLTCHDILIIEKNAIPSVEVIQMSYLYYLFLLIKSDSSVLTKFLTLINLLTSLEFNEENMDKKYEKHDLLVKQGDIDTSKEIYFFNGWDIAFEVVDKKVSLVLGSTILSASDFDELRKIIMYQNILDYTDVQMSEDFKRVVENYYRLKSKGIKVPNLDEKVATVILNTGYTLEEIKELPMYTFDLLFDCGIKKIDYMAQMPLADKLKSMPEHWVYSHDKEKYSDIFSDVDSVTNKIQSV